MNPVQPRPPLNEIRINAIIGAIGVQRDQAQGQVINLTAELAISQDELKQERTRNSELSSRVTALEEEMGRMIVAAAPKVTKEEVATPAAEVTPPTPQAEKEELSTEPENKTSTGVHPSDKKQREERGMTKP